METTTNGANGSHEVTSHEVTSHEMSEPEIANSNGLSFIGTRELYIREHAPQILAAMLVRRSATTPAQMIEEAVSTVADLYDHIKSLR